MSNEPRKPENDPGFGKDLEHLQAGWDRMERAEPPDLLDQAVRNAALRDMEPKRRLRPLRWLGGFATATVAVLALTLMLEQESQLPVPPGEPVEGLKLEKKSADAKERGDAIAPEQAPLPAAEPRPMAREARRESLPAESFSEQRSMTAQEPAEAGSKGDVELNAVKSPGKALMEATTAETLADEEALPQPDAWIESLLALRDAGKQAELEAGLRAFRETYPDYPLPAELSGILP